MLDNPKTKMTQLYRQFSKAGELLYVGISLSALVRLIQHRDNAHWFLDIGRVEIENFPTRESAISAEIVAIKKEKPKWNVQHKKVAEKKSRLECEKSTLIYAVTLQPFYDLSNAARLLNIGRGMLTNLINEKKIGFVELPPFRVGNKSRIRITGWQLLDYIESIGGLTSASAPSAALRKSSAGAWA